MVKPISASKVDKANHSLPDEPFIELRSNDDTYVRRNTPVKPMMSNSVIARALDAKTAESVKRGLN